MPRSDTAIAHSMRRRRARRFGGFAGASLLVLALAGCNALTRLSEIGDPPVLTTIQDPSVLHGNRPVQIPMPTPIRVSHAPNSLWRQGSRHFLKDQRAAEVGDIITVTIEIDDNARLNNTTDRTRGAEEEASLNSFLGYEDALDAIFPEDINRIELVNAESDSDYGGDGAINRDEAINLRVAALVTQVMPNGNLVIAGRQEVRVNHELRELQVAGIIRREDIASTNTINFDQIAEARIAYGGRGTISDVQQPRYGQQVFDIIFPF